MNDVYIATIFAWAPNFAPQNCAFCAGQVVGISQFTALYSLIGVTYGGNGSSNFKLPDLRGRVPLGSGQSPGTSFYGLGALSGSETQTLLSSNLPVHSHSAGSLTTVIAAYQTNGTANVPDNGLALATGLSQAGPTNGVARIYATPAGTHVGLSGGGISGQTGNTGIGDPFLVLQPFQVINWIIVLDGLYPSRP